ncbi:ADP-ribosylglycohydrolase family protein [Microlunatus speluncae]|uniref:ADP-ribosylglycohydrolase family protein n=1 Tax=Microlunatus speluncae TaxID=2594267 RepID=UPI001266764F|nr:ADP-ribosylglycohydrolase family protein [Microlunatus speluncae]
MTRTLRLTWVQPEDLLRHEFVQSRAEGVPVDDLVRRWTAAGQDVAAPVSGASDSPVPPPVRNLAADLLDELARRRPAGDPSQPDDLDAIRALAGPAPVAAAMPAENELFDRIRGAWWGRAAGCLLGKPVEKIPRAGIRAIAAETGNWPVSDYFTARGLSSATGDRWPWNRRSAPTSLRENIDGMPEDDDLNYPMINLGVLDRSGVDFDTEDVAQAWLADLPAGRTFTAERAAYRNLLNGVAIDATARVRNPFREWIGALIRADVFGWVCPGDPGRAAGLAWRDARLSHTRNGRYGAMWAAALTAAALTESAPERVLDRALAVLPPRSDLATAVRYGSEVGRSGAGLDEQLDALHDRYGRLHWVHVLNNAAVIAAAIAGTDGDFTRAIGFAVMAGWDTDSAAATVGSVLGGLLGHSGLPPEWLTPLDNRVDTSLPGGPRRLDDLASRTVRLALGVDHGDQ